MRAHTTHTRDAALRELRRMNRWMIAGSIVLTGVLSDVAANAFPGKTLKAIKTPAKKGTSSSHKSNSPTKTTPLKPPAQAPKAAEAPAPSTQSPPSSESSRASESAPAQEPAPSQESTPPSQESSPPSATPEASRESAPAQEPSAPVVSGGS
jgi:hypothetical protein